MSDISTVRTDLLSIVKNNRLPIKTKRILIKRGLKAINSFIDLKPNKIYNQKKRKIYKILSILSSIKYNVDLKKLLTQEVITELTDFENYLEINSSIEQKEYDMKRKEYQKNFENCIKKIYLPIKKIYLPNKEILIENAQVESEDLEVESEKSGDLEVESEKSGDLEVESEKSEESEESEEILNSDSDTEEESDCDEDSEDSEDSDELDKTVNNLMDDLADDAKAKLIIKLTKYKLEHEYNMEAEKNRNIERMEELALKRLKIKNKYKLKKLENRK
jgi:hypothetical protein